MTDAEIINHLRGHCLTPPRPEICEQAADRLEANANKLQRMEEALVEARDLIKQWSPRVYFDVTVAKLDAALKD